MNNFELTGNIPVNKDSFPESSKPVNARSPVVIIQSHLASLLDSIHKFGITVTGIAPFSSRGRFLILQFPLSAYPLDLPKVLPALIFQKQ
ncbi:MAG TPA: hypothetical protein VGP47_11535 [Parachlamydiaceae bacterium]|nr:hypothetical protein [Parachlamydiaceae bacterium]